VYFKNKRELKRKKIERKNKMAEPCVFLRDGQCRVVCVSNYHPRGQGQDAESIKKFLKT
jgi:excinuclease UvrABC nuclease subunit